MNNIKILTLCLLSTVWSVSTAFSKASRQAEITVNLQEARSTDTLWLSVWSHLLEDRNYMGKPSILTSVTADKDGKFYFKVDMEVEIAYFSLSKDRLGNQNRLSPIFRFYLIEGGDKISVDLKVKNESLSMYGKINRDWDVRFTGKGSEKLIFLQMVNELPNLRNKQEDQFIVDEVYEGNLRPALKLLSEHKSKLSPMVFDVLTADLIGLFLRDGIHDRLGRIYETRNVKINTKIDSLLAKNSWIISKDFCTEKAAFISKTYATFLVDYAIGLCQLYKYDKRIFVFNWIKENSDGLLRDKMLTYFVSKYGRTEYFNETNINELNMLVSNPISKRKIKEELAISHERVLAKSFKLPDVNGKMTSMDSFKDKVIFIDFWFTGCGACSYYYQSTLSVIEKKFKEHSNVVFVTISVDKDISKWKASLDGGEYTSKNAINLYTGGVGINHSVIDDYKVIGYPNPYLIGRDGRIFNADKVVLRNQKGLEDQINLALGQ
jgi:thiol-disulfide isomerase/thioredoxin